MKFLEGIFDVKARPDLVDAIKHGPSRRLVNVGKIHADPSRVIEKPNISFVLIRALTAVPVTMFTNDRFSLVRILGATISATVVRRVLIGKSLPQLSLTSPQEHGDLMYGGIIDNPSVDPEIVPVSLRRGEVLNGQTPDPFTIFCTIHCFVPELDRR